MRNCVAVFGVALLSALFTVPFADGVQEVIPEPVPLSRVFEGCHATSEACVASCRTKGVSWDLAASPCPDSLSCYCLVESPQD